MSALDVSKAYLLAERHNDDGAGTEKTPPAVLQVRLSSEVLEQMMRAGNNGSDEGSKILLRDPRGPEPMMAIGTEEIPFHYAEENGTHQLYSLASTSAGSIESVGNVSAKLTVRPNASASLAAASKLKERREAEQAHKEEHRTKLLQEAPSTKHKSAPSSASLKLRSKPLAPATSSPLLRSRAATPAMSDVASSLPASPSLSVSEQRQQAGSNVGAQGIRRQVLQLLAQGPLQRREIVHGLPFTELQILAILKEIATTPEGLQPSQEDNVSGRKFSVPVNRRHAHAPPSPESSKQPHGPGTVYSLTDEAYREVLVKDWDAYSSSIKKQVADRMNTALDRLGITQDAIERDQVRYRGIKGKEVHSASRDAEVSESEATSGVESKYSSPEKANEKGKSKKPNTLDRLKRAAKGKSLLSSSVRRTESPSRATSASAKAESSAHIKTVVAKEDKGEESPAESRKAEPQEIYPPVPKQSQKRPNASRTGGAESQRSTTRQRFEYTDSSEGDDSSEEERLRKSRRLGGTGGSQPSARGTPVARERQGVGRGATSQAEPWLDVKSAREWRELARRFQRVYEDYTRNLQRLQGEEDLLRTELVQAKSEEARAVEMEEHKPHGVGGANAGVQLPEAEGVDEEPEEGEASPSLERNPASFAGPAHDESAAFAWRQSTLPQNETKKDGASAIGSGNGRASTRPTSQQAKAVSTASTPAPLSIEEMQVLVDGIVDTEDQLKRMRRALETSKDRLNRQQNTVAA